MGKYVEFNEGGGNPLVKVYSRREARKLFSMFREVKVQVEQLTRPEFYFLGRIIPEGIFQRLQRSIGWNVIVSARMGRIFGSAVICSSEREDRTIPAKSM